ncbi:hypothetical protein L249_3116 [Ophiocordyceps polyrhachis-furcata BCC 54312]|uniref:AB hydrolase-1 domain-containing protein n=1 Tax=Ophiocordyceps polyrhachis-furcata BCC 54312 TaxID=1330021 RepID=A0A367LRU1_9HYPO|nr:hypothetical protein L249_3116 [Ophiocordyceps polyrhachis-furcata BCC 54312]
MPITRMDQKIAFPGPAPRRATSGTWTVRFIVTLAAVAGIKCFAAGQKTISWGDCPSDYPPYLDCGRLSVPLDHKCSRPGCRQIELGMVRSKAKASKPLGNLVLNPGGPGSSLVGIFVRGRQDEVVGPKLLHSYNVIAPDPRGVGISTPVRCSAGLYNRRTPLYMTGQADLEARIAWNKAFGESCVRMTGPVIKHVDTVSAAKDLEHIRKALGDEKLNFMGFSYGTQLGSQYAELFPHRVGKMVLDGVLDHSQLDVDGLMTEAISYDDSLKGFFAWCNTTTSCALHGQDASAIFDKLVDEANMEPVPAPGCGGKCAPDVTGYELIMNAQNDVSEPPRWQRLSHSLREALEGNATRLSTQLVRNETSSAFSHTAISCLDSAASTAGGSSLLGRLMAARVLAPHTRGVSETLQIQASCLGWPALAANPPRKLSRDRLARTPPILLVNAFHDPSTSVVWALGVREQMPTAVSIFRDGYGHTSYWDYGETQEAIDSFLIDGRMPADLTVFKT